MTFFLLVLLVLTEEMSVYVCLCDCIWANTSAISNGVKMTLIFLEIEKVTLCKTHKRVSTKPLKLSIWAGLPI